MAVIKTGTLKRTANYQSDEALTVTLGFKPTYLMLCGGGGYKDNTGYVGIMYANGTISGASVWQDKTEDDDASMSSPQYYGKLTVSDDGFTYSTKGAGFWLGITTIYYAAIGEGD